LKLFVKESILYSTGQVLTRLASFILVPFFTYVFSPNEVGHIYLFYSTLTFMNIFNNHGLDSALFKYLSKSRWKKNDLVKSLFLYQLVFLSIFYLIVILFSNQISKLVFKNSNNHWVYVLGLISIFDSLSYRGMVMLRLHSKAILYVLISLGNIIVTIIAIYYFVVYKNNAVFGVFIGVLVASLLQLKVVFFISYFPYIKGKFSFKIIKELLRFGLPFLPAGILFLVIEISDRYFILWQFGQAQVGFYSIAYKIGSIPLMLVSGLNLAWQPFYIKRFNNELTRKLFGEIGTLVLFGFIIFLTIISIWLPLLITYGLIDSQYTFVLKIIPIIFLSYLFYTWYIMQMPSIYLNDKQNWIPLFMLFSATVNIVLNFILIPTYDIYGASISTLFAYLSMGCFIYFKNITWMMIPIKYFELLLLLAFSILFYILSLYCTIVGRVLVVLFYLLLSYMIFLKIISLKDLKKKIFI